MNFILTSQNISTHPLAVIVDNSLIKNIIKHNFVQLTLFLLDILAIYVEHPDKDGHLYGPDSKEVQDVIGQIDVQIGRLLSNLKTTNMSDGSGKMADFVNVMIVSDHGMTYKIHDINITAIIEASSLVDFSDVDEWLTHSGFGRPVAQFWPMEGTMENVGLHCFLLR